MIKSPYLVRPGHSLHLRKIKADDTGDYADKEDVQGATTKNLERLAELQQLLYAEGQQSLLVVLQGMDTSGKDGTIRHVFSGVNPQGCSVVSFKVPSAQEAAHDFLWRIHASAPARGTIAIFNRSHYESVLVERVHTLVPKSVWSERYDHINAFEKQLTDAGTRIVKLFLHISRDEQRQRLQERLQDPTKNWKFNPHDLQERKLWDEYQAAYEDALMRCSTRYAPWYVVPGDHKWFRNWLVSDILVRTLKDMKPKFPPPPEGIETWKVK